MSDLICSFWYRNSGVAFTQMTYLAEFHYYHYFSLHFIFKIASANKHLVLLVYQEANSGHPAAMVTIGYYEGSFSQLEEKN